MPVWKNFLFLNILKLILIIETALDLIYLCYLGGYLIALQLTKFCSN